MDASIENFLVLQKMYSSWEEMIDGYMHACIFSNNDSAFVQMRYGYFDYSVNITATDKAELL